MKQNTSVEHMVVISLIVESHVIVVTRKDTYRSTTIATVQLLNDVSNLHLFLSEN